MGIFADALAAAMNPSCAGGNHPAIDVEHQMLAMVQAVRTIGHGLVESEDLWS